jgi:putative transcriptional regulator
MGVADSRRDRARRPAPPIAWAVVIGAMALAWGLPAIDRVTAARATSPDPPEQPARDAWRRGQVAALGPGTLLVASRLLRDPNFVETVVLLVDHGADGAAGVVVNVPTGVPLARLFGPLKLAEDGAQVSYFGGPVSGGQALALARSDQPLSRARQVAGGIYLVSNRELMEKMLTDGADASRFRVYVGHAGWGPRQLEREVEQNAWHLFAATAEVIFDANPGTSWNRLIRQTEWIQASAR